jgi:hypothetical protein
MSHPQAFHTSCRSGLSGHAGFQFNAASAGLDERALSSLAAAHAGYRAAPDAPAEPGPDQIALLPVALRYLPVEGLGPVVSRTAYIGREFRGHDGEPDSGRFGNYFSHIVVADGDSGEPFGGLMPVELWGAPHWSTDESTSTDLPRLERVEPGPVDLERVLGALLPGREAALAPVLDACLRAVLGGPRVVVVEPDPALAHAWIAWASFALPPDRVGQLTFSTFDGRPRLAEALRVCVTTPACDLDFPPYEVGQSVAIVETAAPATADLSLYARVAAALAREGGEAVAAAVLELDPALDLERAGASLAVAGRRTGLVTAAEAAGVLAALRQSLPRLSAEAALSMAAALPEPVDPAALKEWSLLHAAAREVVPEDDPQLVDLSLGRTLAAFERAAEIAPVAASAAAGPSVGALAGWSSLVSEASDPERLGEVIEAGVRLRLVGRNSALDRELAAAIADRLGAPAVRRAFELLVVEGNEAVVEGVALRLAKRVGEGGSAAALRYVAAYPVAREAVRAEAEQDQSFELTAAWEVLQVAEDRARRPQAVARLAGLATTERQAELIRDLYGERGPADPAEHAELILGWRVAGRNAPAEDYRRALGVLAGLPLARDPASDGLFAALEGAPKQVRASGEHLAWSLLFERPPHRSFADWTWWALAERELFLELPRARRDELRVLGAGVAAAGLGESRYGEGLEDLVELFGRDWLLELGDALARELECEDDEARLLAAAFVEWGRCGRSGPELLAEALPRATRGLSPRRFEAAGEHLRGAQREAWEEWQEEHPPSRAVSRAVRGVFRRGEDKR